MKLATTFRSLQYPNYRLYFIGQSISLVGTWMQRMAVSWLVYQLTHSAFMLGITTFAGQIPSFILSPYGGVITDRHDRYRILLATQIASMLQATVLAILVMTGHYTMTTIIILSIILGAINAFDTPSRQSLLITLVEDKSDLPNAIALNSSMVNLARLLGPTIAGVILARWGEGICFLLNAISFIAVVISLLCMKIIHEKSKHHNKKVWEDFSEGFAYLRHSIPLRRMIIMLGLISLLMMPFTTLLPVFAKDYFKGDAQTFGLINAASGLGALAGAIRLASVKENKFLNKIILIATALFGCFLFFFSFTPYLPVALGFMVVTGLGMMTCIAGGNTFIQTNVSNEMRGRVMSFYVMAFFGMQPIGSFFMGIVAEHIGARQTMGLEGIAGILIAIIFFPLLKNKKLFPPSAADAQFSVTNN